MKPEEPEEPFEIELLPPSAVPPPVPSDPRSFSGRPTIPPPVVIETPLVTEDEQIYCPICNYNLSGIFSGRCPECGSLFSRDALIAAQQANQITLIPWDDPEPMPFRRRLIETLRVCLLSAERFAFAFSVQPQETRAAAFFTGVTAGVTFMMILTVLVSAGVSAMSKIPTNPDFPHPAAWIMAALVFTPLTLILSTLLSALFLAATCRHYDGKRHLRPWLSICAYSAAHYLLIFPIILVALAAPLTDIVPPEAMMFLMTLLLWMGCGRLAVFTLNTVIRFRSSEGRGVGVFLLILIHLGTAIFCRIATLLTADYLGPAFSR